MKSALVVGACLVATLASLPSANSLAVPSSQKDHGASTSVMHSRRVALSTLSTAVLTSLVPRAAFASDIDTKKERKYQR